MVQLHLILVDEQSQADRLKRISNSFKRDGIELIYTEINPNDIPPIRLDSGDIKYDMDAFKNRLESIPYLTHLDVIATDYNLVQDDLKGIDVISIIYQLLPYYCGKIVIYSAKIEDVINNIITKRTTKFEEQISMLKLLARNEIHYLNSEREFENKFKMIIAKESNPSIDARLADSLLALDNDNFRCSIPEFTDYKLSEIGQLLNRNDSESIRIRKEITEQILAYITSIHDYE